MAEANMMTATGSVRSVRASGFMTMLPARLVMAYLLVTLVLFVYWPINWPIYAADDWLQLFGYVLACFAILYFMFSRGAGGVATMAAFASSRRIIMIGAVLAAVLLAPSSYFYAGRWPWQILQALQDQGEAYRGLQDTLNDTAGQRGPIALLRALAAPFVFGVLPLGILNWKRLNWTARFAVLVAPLCSLIFSVLRGTDREFADVFIVGGSALLVSLARQAAERGQIWAVLRRYWRPAVLILLFLALATSLFANRKEARLGGVNSVCAVGTGICVDLADPKITWMGDQTLFAVSIFTISVSQGYYGLSLGMHHEFQSTYGLGHSPSVMALYESTTGDTKFASRSLTNQLISDGWPPEYFWSTGLIWFANDVGFLGVLPLLALMAFGWGRSWRDAIYRNNDAAAVLFCLFMVMVVYLPANNQVFNTFDGYFVISFWLWAWQKSVRAKPGNASRLR
jgi:hypothetical protein